MVTEKRVKVDWSNLPNELLFLIANDLNATIDILRFRSTCTSWRSAVPLPSPSSHTLFPPQTRIPLPPPPSSRTLSRLRNRIPHGEFALIQTKIYRLEPSSTSTSSSSKKGWIIMVADSKSLPIRLLDPFTSEPLSVAYPTPDSTPPKVLNLLDFRVINLVEAYSFNYGCRRVPKVLKVVLLPKSRMVVALYKNGKLRVSKIGDEGWMVLDVGDFPFDDAILHTGQDQREQLYVVDKSGIIWWVDCSSLKLTEFSPKLPISGKKKRLVECNGSLYVVDMYLERDANYDIKVYRLDKEQGRWFDVKDLGDVVFILGRDCNFSISACDYYGYEGNWVYFYSRSWRVRAFRLKNSQFESPKPLWPRPSLFDQGMARKSAQVGTRRVYPRCLPPTHEISQRYVF